jgi:RNA 3'-terminal phosphate cyclase
MGEGGGQLFRMSVALTYLLNQSLSIYDIRKGRARRAGPGKPLKGGGLKNQHLLGLNTTVQMAKGSQVQGNSAGSMQVDLAMGEPFNINVEEYTADCGSPGAIGLIL